MKSPNKTPIDGSTADHNITDEDEEDTKVIGDKMIFIANTHWDQGREARRNGAFIIREEILSLSGNVTPNVVLLGDFNCQKESNNLSILRTGIDKVYSKVMPKKDDEEYYSEEEEIEFELLVGEDAMAASTASANSDFKKKEDVKSFCNSSKENSVANTMTSAVTTSATSATVDFIFVSKAVLVKQYVVCEDTLVSSHRPVIMDALII